VLSHPTADTNHDFLSFFQYHPDGAFGAYDRMANKFLSHTRIKRSGAWWVDENGNAMLWIRCALYNGTFQRVFEHYKQQNQCRPS